MPELNEEERDQIAHAIGHHSAKGCSVNGGRNRYCTAADDPLWLGLVERGLAVKHGSPLLIEHYATFHVTQKGIEALEMDPRRQRTGRRYAVTFKHSASPTYVYAEKPSRAKYQAILEVADCYPDGLTFKDIRSCRLA